MKPIIMSIRISAVLGAAIAISFIKGIHVIQGGLGMEILKLHICSLHRWECTMDKTASY